MKTTHFKDVLSLFCFTETFNVQYHISFKSKAQNWFEMSFLLKIMLKIQIQEILLCDQVLLFLPNYYPGCFQRRLTSGGINVPLTYCCGRLFLTEKNLYSYIKLLFTSFLFFNALDRSLFLSSLESYYANVFWGQTRNTVSLCPQSRPVS